MRLALYEPDIPQNCGALIRLAACLGVGLDIIEPCGFLLDDKRLKRAGLDYHELASTVRHRNFESFLGAIGTRRLFGFSTKASQIYSEAEFADEDVLLFGPETRGLPNAVRAQLGQERMLRLPMVTATRSLNLANAVAVAVYEAWRQLRFPFPRT